jgi:hypothetical protein
MQGIINFPAFVKDINFVKYSAIFMIDGLDEEGGIY